MDKITTKEVIEWAKQFQEKAEKELTADEIKEQKKFASLVQTPNNKTLLSKMLDESSQIRNDKKLAKRMKLLIEEYGVPDFFSPFDQFQLKLFTNFGYLFPTIAIPLFKNRLREETDKIIISEERPALTKHLRKRWDARIGQNVNLLGEVVLGDKEANNRYEHYIEALKEPDINYISIKLSGIYAQIRSLGYEQNKEELCRLVANIFQCAIDHPYINHNGKSTPKFVNLDMEEYKDTEITLDVFTTVLSMPQFQNYTAGIVIQAYLPDGALLLEKLLKFAKNRYANGGAPLKFRLVKGANLQMESITSSLKGWKSPILPTKIDVDANYMHILDIAMQPENAKALYIGVASHNFFSIGYAYLLSKKNGVEDYVTFEMLEGMANNLPRVMRSLQKQIILYTPVVRKENFLNAVSYLVRRLDENTGKDNFLSYTFDLKVEGKEWEFLKGQFIEADKKKISLQVKANREQDRTKEILASEINTFKNEPDTDIDLSANRKWALNILKKWKNEITDKDFVIPAQVGNREELTEHKRKYYDRSRNDEASFCEVNLSTIDQVKEIVEIAEADKANWRKLDLAKRKEILHKTANNLANKRGELLGCMAAITGKTLTEGDVEVSEAIDFARFYPITMKPFDDMETVSNKPKGTILVISPWNFPLAIPVGGVSAALAAGNTVILKPATVAMPIAWEFAKCFWDAGVPKEALQIVCPADRKALSYLSSHPTIKHTILTGGTDTAFDLLKASPRTPLSAETGGKNAIILTESGDQDHAILNIVASAFGNAGQKCSACSLLLVEKGIYHDEAFKAKLQDAVQSMRTGSVWDGINVVGPMITNKNEKLMHAIEHLEEGESWLVEPTFLDEKKYILQPCVKWGVKPTSYTFRNELFAPLLAVVCIDSLEEGIKYVNSSEYGLTSGLQSLDENEQALWKSKIEAGNLYINRGITGAIVDRQPFGGMKRSAFGGGVKAGGPNYVSCFVDFTENEIISPIDADYLLSDLLPNLEDKRRLNYAYQSMQKAWLEEFSEECLTQDLYGEENTFRYLPLKNCGFRIVESDNLVDILIVMTASDIAKTPLMVSLGAKDKRLPTIERAANMLENVTLTIEDKSEFLDGMINYDRIRTCSPNFSENFYKTAAELGKHVASQKPLIEGRLEMLHYLKEQSISFEYHRYGSVFGED